MPSMTTPAPIDARAVIARLAEQFPKAFSVYERRRRPLKLGIHLDIAAATAGAVTEAELSAALRVYFSNSFYLRACTAGAARIDLGGAPAGAVSANEAERAAEVLAARARKWAARSAAISPPKANGAGKAASAAAQVAPPASPRSEPPRSARSGSASAI